MKTIKLYYGESIPNNFTGIAKYPYPDGSKEWYKENKLHRIDGPAIMYLDGINFWYIEGNFYSPKLLSDLINSSFFLGKERGRYNLEWLKFLTEEVIKEFPIISGMKEYKVFTDKGIFYLQTSENSLFLNDDQLFLKKGKIEVTPNFNSFNIKKHLLKLQTPTFERWDLYSCTEEIDSEFLNIFFEIKFVSLNNEEFASGLLHYTAWHPIFQDVIVKIEPQGFRWTPVREV